MYIFYGCMADERQFLILSERMLSVHELNENKNDNIWNMPTPDNQDGVAVALETRSSYNLGYE